MSQFKHTPGPWSVHNCKDIFTDLGAKNSEGVEAPSDDGWMIADCDMGGLHFDEVRANAYLIAAAPELLEVLQEAQEVIGTLSQYEMPIGLDDRINAAIAKATGEA